MAEDFPTRTPGEILRAAREARGADLAAAHEGTKIPPRLLEALERDEYHRLSGPLYVKSFLRNYAGWLGLDDEEVLRVYEVATGRPEVTPGGQEMVWTEDEVKVTRVGGPSPRLAVWIGGAVVLIAVIVAAVIGIAGRDGDPSASPDQDAPAAPNVPGAETGSADQPTGAAASPGAGATPDGAAGDGSADGATAAAADPDPDPGQDASVAGAARPADRPVARGPAGAVAGPAGAEVGAAGGRAGADLLPAPRGDGSLRFQGGTAYPLVLRVVVPEPVNCSVRRDGEGPAVPVIWPENPAPPPAYNVRHGVAYAVRGGYAVYWGAEDHFTLSLDRLAGAEVTLNGEPQPVGRWRPGEPVVLDAFAAANGN